MRIEHVAMYVNNLEKEKEFFEISGWSKVRINA